LNYFKGVSSFSLSYLTPIPSFSEIRGLGGFEQTTGSFHKEDQFHKPPRQTPKLSYSGAKTLEPGPLIVNRFLLLSECVVKNAEPWPGMQETETSV
jgi:hypothetical protein